MTIDLTASGIGRTASPGDSQSGQAGLKDSAGAAQRATWRRRGEGGGGREEQAGGVQGGDAAAGAGPGGEQGGDEADAKGVGDALADAEHGAAVGEMGGLQCAGDGVEQLDDN
jgi:hypothetical protein